MLTLAKAGKRNGYLLEGMACPGGCVAGAGTIRPIRESMGNVAKFKEDAAEESCTASPFLDRLDEVLE
jgi:iron only hydrogenase large subunit-like protein